mmetsp:Transcript_34862/g.82284  ORF Transcript_34862/g.82284 Transcript_34862/m.82284 type:complete len:270 (-) Transcript_34862:493-1302(-)
MECLLRTNMRQNLQVGRPGRPGRARVLGAAHTCENRRAVIGSVVQTALPTKNPRDCLDHGQGLHVGRPTPTSSSSCSRRSYSAESGSEIARTTCCSVVHAARHGLHQPAQQLRHVRHRQHRRRLGAVRGGARHLQEGRAAPRGGQGAHRLHLVHRARDRVCRAHRRGGGLGDARQGAAAAAARQGGDAVLHQGQRRHRVRRRHRGRRPGGRQRRARRLPADVPQEGQGVAHRHLAHLLLRQERAVRLARGVHLGAQRGPHPGRGREVLR